jgi:hypothetical protein
LPPFDPFDPSSTAYWIFFADIGPALTFPSQILECAVNYPSPGPNCPGIATFDIQIFSSIFGPTPYVEFGYAGGFYGDNFSGPTSFQLYLSMNAPLSLTPPPVPLPAALPLLGGGLGALGLLGWRRTQNRSSATAGDG